MRIRGFAAITGLVVSLTLAAGQQAQAAFDFTITTTIPVPPGGSVTAPSGNSTVTLMGPLTSPASGNATPPGTNIVFGQVQLGDNGVSTSYTDSYAFAYEFDVTLTDVTSGLSGVFKITGTLTGTITDNGGSFSSLFANVYDAPLSQTLSIGGNAYTVTVANTSGFYTNPSPPQGAGMTSSTNGTFSANVIASVPEPASMTLVGIGGLLGVGLLRRRRSVS